jgi:aryl-alcohol dehydrogenase-like predicted oxidoreductase
MTMRYRLLGKSGLRVSEWCLGTMTFGEDWGWGANAAECREMFEIFASRGGNFIDTANFYTGGNSERIVGNLIRQERERYVLATKFSLGMRDGDPNSGGNHRKNIIRSLEDSLKRLQTDYIDLYWLHAWDFTTPVEEIMRTLDDLVAQGKILYVGISDTPAWIVAQANTLASLRGWSPFVALQIEYSLVERTAERDLLPMAKAFELAVTPWSPLGGGILTGKYNDAVPEEGVRLKADNRRFSEKNLTIAREVSAVAREIGCEASQVALAWIRSKGLAYIPIIGARSGKQLASNLDAENVNLAPEHLARLEAVSAVERGFPHDFLDSESVRKYLHAGTEGLLDGARR